MIQHRVDGVAGAPKKISETYLLEAESIMHRLVSLLTDDGHCFSPTQPSTTMLS